MEPLRRVVTERLLVGLLLASSAPAVLAQGDPDWETNLPEARARAKSPAKPVLLYVYTGEEFEPPRAMGDKRVRKLCEEFVLCRLPSELKLFGSLNLDSAPSVVVLNVDGLEIHRFGSFGAPKYLIPELEESLRRWRLCLKDEDWDKPKPRATRICDWGEIRTFPAPSEKQPRGLTFVKGKAWIIQGTEGFVVAPKDGRVLHRFQVPHFVRDITNDGRYVYILEPHIGVGLDKIHVMDSDTREVKRVLKAKLRVRTIMGAENLAWTKGSLWALNDSDGPTLFEVSPIDGRVLRSHLLRVREFPMGMGSSEGHLVTADKRGLLLWAIDGGRPHAIKRLKCNYPIRSVASFGDAFAMIEEPVYLYDRNHKKVRAWPKRTVVHIVIPHGKRRR